MNNSISLRKKLLLWLLFPMLCLWVISAVASYLAASKFANMAYDRSLADSARDLAKQVVVENSQESLDLPLTTKKLLLSDEYDTIYFKVTASDGRVIAGEPDLPRPSVIGKTESPIIHDGYLRGHKLRIASRFYVPSGSLSHNPVLVQLAETLNKRKSLAWEIVIALVVPQLILIISALLVVRIGISKGLQPLKRLQHEISARSHRDLSSIDENYTPMEVRPIIHAINNLMDRLDKSIAGQERFISNAAHQLRTPIAGMKTQIDLALRQSNKETLQHSLEQINISVNRIVRLVNQMLALSQVEPDATKVINMKSINLSEIVKRTTMEWVPFALNKSIDLGYEGSEQEIIIKGEEFRIKVLLDNLLDNAIRFSPPGSSVTTKLEKSDNIVLSVEDNGPGIPSEQRNLVFQRFYRVPGNNGEGSGLGLSIVKEIANLYEATVIIGNPPHHTGTLVKFIFPPSTLLNDT